MPDPVATTLEWGVGTEANVGVVQGRTINETAEVAEAKDETGRTIAMKAYSKTTEVSIEALVSTGVTLPQIGATATLGEKNVLVTSVNTTSSNSDFKKVSITGQVKDSATLTAYGS